MHQPTATEQAYLDRIHERLDQLRAYLNTSSLDTTADVSVWYTYIAEIRAIQGNINNDLSFLSVLLAKKYLVTRFDIGPFDVAIKAQGAPGLDIDVMTTTGERIVAEVKTTVPYTGAKHDLGAQQKKSFQQDFEKLNTATATYKFLFVTDLKTFDILKHRYADRIPDVEIVLVS